MWVELVLKTTSEQFCICVCYLPPEGSSRNVDPRGFFDSLLSQIIVYHDRRPYMICGDFNARCANEMILGQNPPRQNPPGQNPPTKTPLPKPPGDKTPLDKTPPGQNPPGQNPPDKTPRTKLPRTKPPRTKPPGQNPPGQNPPDKQILIAY